VNKRKGFMKELTI